MNTKEVTIQVIGPAGSGKSAIIQVVAQALAEAGLSYSMRGAITIRPQSQQDLVLASIKDPESLTNITIIERTGA